MSTSALVGETYRKRLIVFYIPLFLFVFAMLFPFFWMLITSIKTDAELYNRRISPFLVRDPTLEHWRMLFQDTLFLQWTWNTLWVATVSTGISLFAGVLGGYALARLTFRGSTVFSVWIFITYLVPPALLFIPLTGVMSFFGLVDSRVSLMFAYPTFLVPFCIWLLIGYFQTIPKELEECARIDGATRVQAMVKIVLPLAVPGILSAGIFAFTLSWNEFPLRPRVPFLAREQDGTGGGDRGADPRRRVLLGAADGRSSLRVRPRGHRVLVLRRTLRLRNDRGG